MSVANIVLNDYIAIYSSDTVASYGIAYKIDMVPIMLPVGLSQGVIFPHRLLRFGAGDAVFLHEEALIDQAGYFLKVLCMSAPTLGVINMVTNDFLALGKALHPLPRPLRSCETQCCLSRR